VSQTLSVSEYRATFKLDGEGWAAYDQDCALLQLGMPTSRSIVLWFVARRGERPELEVSIQARRLAGVESKPLATQEERTQLTEQGPIRIEIFGLAPDTTYEVKVSFEESGTSSHQSLLATTAPAGDVPKAFSFLTASCCQPYAGGNDECFITQQTTHVLELFRRRAAGTSTERPAFALGLGDQVYVDVGSRAMLRGWRSQEPRYAPGDAEPFFETAYRSTFSLTPLHAARQTLPSAMMWDDHEIRDGWGAQGDENSEHRGQSRWHDHLRAARQHFVSWQAFRNPPPNAARADGRGWQTSALPGADLTQSPELDFQLDWGRSATFFVMDLRSQRSAARRRVVSSEQVARLSQWLERPRVAPSVFVLCSPMPLTQVRMAVELAEYLVPARWDDLRDSWWSKQCRQQRNELLKMMRGFFEKHRQHRLLVLSGDVHFSEVLELSTEDGRVFGHEVVSSGFAHSKYQRFGRRSSQSRKQLAHDVYAAGLGRFHGPAFSELFFTPRASGVKVEVSFHVAASQDGKCLANTHSLTPPRVELPSSPLSLEAAGCGGIFDQFIQLDASGIEPTGPARGFR